MDEPEELSQDKCRELLAAGVVGRLAFVVAGRPYVVPLNYTVVGDAVVFRTTPYSVLGREGVASHAAFEVDNLDYADHVGWSVVAHGVVEHVESVAELAGEAMLWDPRPWAGGSRLLYLRLPWRELTGRRLGHGWTRANEVPVRQQA